MKAPTIKILNEISQDVFAIIEQYHMDNYMYEENTLSFEENQWGYNPATSTDVEEQDLIDTVHERYEEEIDDAMAKYETILETVECPSDYVLFNALVRKHIETTLFEIVE